MPFELLKSEVLMKGRAFAIRRDTLKTPDGRETKFEIIAWWLGGYHPGR